MVSKHLHRVGQYSKTLYNIKLISPSIFELPSDIEVVHISALCFGLGTPPFKVGCLVS